MSDYIHKDLIRGFIHSTLLATDLLTNQALVNARVSVLKELDAAFDLEIGAIVTQLKKLRDEAE